MKKKLSYFSDLLWALAIILALCLYAFFSYCEHTTFEESPIGKNEYGYMYNRTCTNCGVNWHKKYKAIVTFIDDDGRTQAMLHWEKIIDATGIPMTSAIIPKKIKDTTNYDNCYSYAGWDLLDRMAEKGVELVNHTYSHTRLTTMTPEEIREDFEKSINILSEHGIDSNILVYPFYNYNDEVMDIAKEYFDAAFCGNDKAIVDVTASPLALDRVKIEDTSKPRTIKFTKKIVVDCYTVKSAKAMIKDLKKTILKSGWLVYVVHAHDSPSGQYYFDETSEQTVIDFCNYVFSRSKKDIKIVTASEGLIAAQPIS